MSRDEAPSLLLTAAQTDEAPAGAAARPGVSAGSAGFAPSDAPAAPARTRVTKTLWPGQPGTLKLRQRHGPALLCVRYRHDADNQRRYTTVEIIVDEAPLPPRDRRRRPAR